MTPAGHLSEGQRGESSLAEGSPKPHAAGCALRDPRGGPGAAAVEGGPGPAQP